MLQTRFNMSPKMLVLYLKFFHELVTQQHKQQIARCDTNNTFFHSLFFQIHVQSSVKLWSICLYTQMLLEHQDDNVLSKKEKNDNWFYQVMSWYLATVETYTEISDNSWWRSPHAATKIICWYVVIFKLLIAVKCSVHAKFLEWPIPSSLIRASMTQLRIQAKNNKINNSNIITWHKL